MANDGLRAGIKMDIFDSKKALILDKKKYTKCPSQHIALCVWLNYRISENTPDKINSI